MDIYYSSDLSIPFGMIHDNYLQQLAAICMMPDAIDAPQPDGPKGPSDIGFVLMYNDLYGFVFVYIDLC